MPAILVPVDGSIHALKALHIACDLGDKYGASILLLHVLIPAEKTGQIADLPIAGKLPRQVVQRSRVVADDNKGSVRMSEEDLRTVADVVLQDAAGRTKRRGIETEVLDIASGDPVEEILIAQRRTGANTIVMGCRGLRDVEQKAFGSVSQEVFRKADCTCISVK